ncbi:Arc family DNA-binding protein [Grimontia marina]|uniref:Arc-like DNA binding domain protein n=1 Tax=Grimontia marina TaxID=646534 RepID=A0A128F073_9GAMM|nr:Arc family DNA-binding protein [Grimontia marina]CZF79636.1 Arc-like DNA binding domain protein [Grimontia marina]
MSLQFKVRLTEELHEKLKNYADAKGNSLNTEILQRLADSVVEDEKYEPISADSAKQKAADSRQLVLEDIRRLCYFEINRVAQLGGQHAHISLKKYELYSYTDEAWEEAITPIVKELKDKGFDVNENDVSEDGFGIRF